MYLASSAEHTAGSGCRRRSQLPCSLWDCGSLDANLCGVIEGANGVTLVGGGVATKSSDVPTYRYVLCPRP
jgi:hypothetical protein